MNYGKDQIIAIRMAKDWFNSLRSKIFVIGGFAGTGKSTVLKQVLYDLGIPMYKVAFATYTGKAAIVLRRLGYNAYTLHKLLYNIHYNQFGKPYFKLKKNLPSNIELLVIDELGMVPDSIINDALSFGIPILGLGDPGQLPPIYGDNSFIKNANVFLSEVFRQQSGSSLLELATDIRMGINPFNKKYNNDVAILEGKEFNPKMMLQFDQILCSKNDTKMQLNMLYRNTKFSKPEVLPMQGEKLICLENNFKTPIASMNNVDIFLVNGLIGFSDNEAIPLTDKSFIIYFSPEFLPMTCASILASPKIFYNYYDAVSKKYADLELDMADDEGRIINKLDFGYVITTHKSQGSEWNNVLVLDDCFYNDEENYIRWLYTSVTRAKTKVTIIKNVNI